MCSSDLEWRKTAIRFRAKEEVFLVCPFIKPDESHVKIGGEDFTDDTITLCPSSLLPIKTIHVEGSSGDAKAQEPDCNTFRPDAATVRRYFSKAQQISDQDWMHKLIWITCEASGSITLEDGRKARWGLSPNRSALVTIEGEPYQKFFLFCSKADCGFPPFW